MIFHDHGAIRLSKLHHISWTHSHYTLPPNRGDIHRLIYDITIHLRILRFHSHRTLSYIRVTWLELNIHPQLLNQQFSPQIRVFLIHHTPCQGVDIRNTIHLHILDCRFRNKTFHIRGGIVLYNHLSNHLHMRVCRSRRVVRKLMFLLGLFLCVWRILCDLCNAVTSLFLLFWKLSWLSGANGKKSFSGYLEAIKKMNHTKSIF
jgi:hypothetical protein